MPSVRTRSPGSSEGRDPPGHRGEARLVDHSLARQRDLLGDQRAGHPRDGLLPGWEDVEYADDVGQRKGLTEFGGERLGPAVGAGLEDRDQAGRPPPRPGPLGQYGGHLGRVMGVVVIDRTPAASP